MLIGLASVALRCFTMGMAIEPHSSHETTERDAPSDSGEPAKAMSLRMSAEQARELELVAQIDGIAMAEAVRRAIDAYVAERAADRDFQERSKRALAQHIEILKKFAG
jgi:predicted DNA-binding protein